MRPVVDRRHMSMNESVKQRLNGAAVRALSAVLPASHMRHPPLVNIPRKGAREFRRNSVVDGQLLSWDTHIQKRSVFAF